MLRINKWIPVTTIVAASGFLILHESTRSHAQQTASTVQVAPQGEWKGANLQPFKPRRSKSPRFVLVRVVAAVVVALALPARLAFT